MDHCQIQNGQQKWQKQNRDYNDDGLSESFVLVNQESKHNLEPRSSTAPEIWEVVAKERDMDSGWMGRNNNEIIWAQNQEYKLYTDGTLYAVADRYEKNPIPPNRESNHPAERARRMLREAIDSMPASGQKLLVRKSQNKSKD